MLLHRLKNITLVIIIFGFLVGSIVTACSFFMQKMHPEHSAHVNTSTDSHLSISKDQNCCGGYTAQHHTLSSVAEISIKRITPYQDLFMINFLLLFFIISYLASKDIARLYFYYKRRSFNRPIYFLQLAFAKGILNPKIYNA